jgi:hypothetical protein
MLYAKKNASPEYPEHAEFVNAIAGALFFGVPSQGMEIESLIPLVKDQPNEVLLKSLSVESPLLELQCQDFLTHFTDWNPRIAYFWETVPSPTAIEVGGAELLTVFMLTKRRFRKTNGN